MEPHIVELPRRIAVGRGVISGLDNDFRTLRIEGRPLIITGRNTLTVAGKLAAETLREWDPKIELVNGSSLEEAERVANLAEGFTCIVSVGGGRTIDLGKVAAYKKGLCFVSVPTAPSHDGIASERAGLNHGSSKISVRARPPLAVVADIDILMNAPKRLIASGAADALSNLTSVQDWKISRDDKGEYYSDYSAYLAKSSAKMILRSAGLIGSCQERGIRDLMEALLTSSISMSLAGSSRPASGAEHAFSHSLDELGSNALHGEQCGVGSILTSCLQGREWELIRDTLKEVGAPTTSEGLGIGEDTVVKALLRAGSLRNRYTILDREKLTDKKARELCRKTGVTGA